MNNEWVRWVDAVLAVLAIEAMPIPVREANIVEHVANHIGDIFVRDHFADQSIVFRSCPAALRTAWSTRTARRTSCGRLFLCVPALRVKGYGGADADDPLEQLGGNDVQSGRVLWREVGDEPRDEPLLC